LTREELIEALKECVAERDAALDDARRSEMDWER
jgi:hypothetical protein